MNNNNARNLFWCVIGQTASFNAETKYYEIDYKTGRPTGSIALTALFYFRMCYLNNKMFSLVIQAGNEGGDVDKKNTEPDNVG